MSLRFRPIGGVGGFGCNNARLLCIPGGCFRKSGCDGSLFFFFLTLSLESAMTCLCMHSMRFWILPSDSQYFRNAMATFSSPGAETASTNQVYRFIYIYLSSKVCAGVCTQLTGSLWISSPCWPKIHNVGNLPPLWLISGKSYKLFSSSSARIWQPFWCWASVQGCIHFENALQLLCATPFS